ncbi:hypothetical protein SMU52_05544 [Streptococcus mutans NFSM2]|nr:hypothetical protein SMU52_05544 [Streptococcus mutans NFSM2]
MLEDYYKLIKGKWSDPIVPYVQIIIKMVIKYFHIHEFY